MTPKAIWQRLPAGQAYESDTLAVEGFTHCTAEPDMLLQVANRFYKDVDGPFVLLCIDETLVTADVRWEMADGHRFPHIYGPLNRDAIVDVLPFPRRSDGSFVLPDALA